jgi:maltokinase
MTADVRLDEQALEEWVVAQRWFGSKAREVTSLGVLDMVPLRLEPRLLASVMVEARFAPGTHEVYQVPVAFRPVEEGWSESVISETGGLTIYDALADPEEGQALLELMRANARLESEHAVSEFHWVEGTRDPGPSAVVRPMGAEQSNSSLVFDEALALKLYRRVEAGVNPELELLRFLTDRGFESVPALAGWYEYSGRLMEATLGVMQEFLPGARDGWELALEELGSEPEAFLERVRALGEVTGRLHTALGSAASNPAFAPEEPSSESLALLTATIDEEIERIFLDVPEGESVEPIAGRGEDVREQLRLLTHVGSPGKVIRTHGDYHLGQAIWNGESWVIFDFEGEPARSVVERRRKRSPLRDVAGMLRSFAYAASAAELERSVEPPEGWEERARDAFLGGYVSEVDPNLIPSGSSFDRLLAVFELEKAVYELRYELDNRPDWVRIPVAGVLRLLERAPA